MSNTYTIQGLQVPYLEGRLADLAAELASTRTLLTATADALQRIDADVVLILEALGVSRED